MQTILSKVDIQKFLAIITILTYGLADAYTSAIMMGVRGIQIESSPVAAYAFKIQGLWGVIAIKVSYTIIILFAIYLIQRNKKNVYWKVNAVLIITSIFGLLAAIANIEAISGNIFLETHQFLIIYMLSVVICIEIGDILDEKYNQVVYKERNQ